MKVSFRKHLTTNEYINYQLPPLDSLFEGAKTNPRLKAIGASIEAARNDLKATKRDWLQYFSVRAGYTYGILGTYTDQESQYTPLTTVYSGATQNSWSVGANIIIPFNRFFQSSGKREKTKRTCQECRVHATDQHSMKSKTKLSSCIATFNTN